MIQYTQLSSAQFYNTSQIIKRLNKLILSNLRCDDSLVLCGWKEAVAAAALSTFQPPRNLPLFLPPKP